MDYGYYDDLDNIFDIRDMRDSDELVMSTIEEQLNATEEQIDSILREVEHISSSIQYMRERLEEITGG